LPQGAFRPVDPRGWLCVTPVQAQGPSKVAYGFVVLAERKKNPAPQEKKTQSVPRIYLFTRNQRSFPVLAQSKIKA
jgi:hypothetical protein